MTSQSRGFLDLAGNGGGDESDMSVDDTMRRDSIDSDGARKRQTEWQEKVAGYQGLSTCMTNFPVASRNWFTHDMVSFPKPAC